MSDARFAVRDAPKRSRGLAAALLVVVGLGLAWTITREALVQRLSPLAAAAIDPGSSSALTRAAEAELKAGHANAAQMLARRALASQPFNVAALGVVGFVAAARDGPDSADQLMTLAGDWSLRDGLTQVWLFQQRLRQGAYGSAFAHGDTLIRLTDEVREPIFKVFTLVAEADQRALAPLALRLAANPPWRQAFFASLNSDPQGQNTAVGLAMALAPSGHPATNVELTNLLNGLVRDHRYGLADLIWRRLSVGGKSKGQPFDGDFNGPASPEPFGWLVSGGVGSTAEIMADSDRPNERVLRVEYDGYSTPDLLKTFMVLAPGAYRLSGRLRNQSAEGADQLGWIVKCADDGQLLAEARGSATTLIGVWQPFTVPFAVPASGCQGQWLQLLAHPGERRTDITVWYANLAVAH